jgi:hypothetical protein
LALLLAAIPIAMDFTASRSERRAIQEQKQSLYLAAMEDLRWNDDWLRAVAVAVRQNEGLPIGGVRTDALVRVTSEDHDHIVDQSYGEEEYLYQEVLRLDAIAKKLNSIKSANEFRQFDRNSKLTLHDAVYLNGFLAWYIGATAKQELSPRQLESLSWPGDSSDKFSLEGIKPVHMKYFADEQGPFADYGHYLGLLD